ncbi:hypothetical protein GW17_00026054 [Ensete ventricosum]|nr:hypothetical protein GW17_00026054 [Ensete ventricosum]
MVTGRSYLRSSPSPLLTMSLYFTMSSVVLAARRTSCLLQLEHVDLAHLTCPNDCCLCAHGLFWTLRLSLRVQSREPVTPIEGPELTTVASVETPKSSNDSSVGVSSLLQ